MSARLSVRAFAAALAVCIAAGCTPPRTRGTLPLPRAPLTATPDAPFRAEAPPPAEPAPFVASGVERFALANGIPVYFVRREDPPVVAVRYINRRAGEDDLRVEPGLAQITTRMLAEGTTVHPGASFAQALGALGASLETETGRDASAVMVSAPAEQLARAAALLAEAVRQPAFAPADFTAARNAQMDRRAAEALGRAPLALAMAGELLFGAEHAYGRPITGIGPLIRGRRREQLVAFHRERFVPGNSALVVVGATDARAVAAALAPAFGAWSASAPATPPSPAGALPGHPRARVHVVDARSARQTHVLIAWRGPTRATPDYPALLVLDRVLGGMFSSRLNLALRADAGYTYGASSRLQLHRAGGLIVARTNVATDETGAALRRALAEIARLRDAPPAEREVATARALVRDALISAYERATDTAELVGLLVVNELPMDYHAALLAAVDSVTGADVQRAAQRYLAAESALIVMVGNRDVVDGPAGALGMGAVEHYTFQ